jgi:LacI family transcriptional regulator
LSRRLPLDYIHRINEPDHARPQRRPTLRDVAGHAQVSFKTVSRVVNGEGGVSPQLVRRVEASIAELGYRPDDRARRLRNTEWRTGVIGFVLVDVSNPFFSSILRGIEEIARKHDYFVLSGSTDGEPARQDQLVSAFISRRVDGMIVVPSGDELGPLAHEITRGTPMVFVDLEPAGVAVDLLRSDHQGGAYEATRHLLKLGHRDIAFFGSTLDIFSARLRLEGFREAMAEAGIRVPDTRIRSGLHSPEQWKHIVSEFLEKEPRPTAIFTAQNFITLGALQALHALGLRSVIAQIGFDDVDLSEVVSPGVSVVPQYPLELGRRAAEMLFRRLDGLSQTPIREILRNRIVERGSGEIPPSW